MLSKKPVTPTIRVIAVRMKAKQSEPPPTSLEVAVDWTGWHYTTTHILATTDGSKWRWHNNYLTYIFSEPVTLDLPALPFYTAYISVSGIVKFKLKRGKKNCGKCKMLVQEKDQKMTDDNDGMKVYCRVKYTNTSAATSQ
ncbi:hypothetical protein Pmani_037028 [Petrolisthes manimaculis]|uniref:Uncharacterized protein n=1 Tax=Petrolisthes manimaculis TaxID=1843537 RepID=A0AAE1NJ10_9EUCA|nr:hypothetical protein Pmani_037028 [Petrolisthes manimaculis]